MNQSIHYNGSLFCVTEFENDNLMRVGSAMAGSFTALIQDAEHENTRPLANDVIPPYINNNEENYFDESIPKLTNYMVCCDKSQKIVCNNSEIYANRK